MRNKLCSDEQIVKILKEEEQGRDIKNIIQELGISERTFYRWKSSLGGLNVDKINRIKVLEDENRLLKKLVGDLKLTNSVLMEELDNAMGRLRELQNNDK